MRRDKREKEKEEGKEEEEEKMRGTLFCVKKGPPHPSQKTLYGFLVCFRC